MGCRVIMEVIEAPDRKGLIRVIRLSEKDHIQVV